MTRNIDQFNAFAAKLLDILYDEFPIPIDVRRADFVESPDVQAWLRRIDEAIAATPRDGNNPFARAEAASEQSSGMASELKVQEAQKAVFSGTMQFLIAEGFIRYAGEPLESDLYRSCQLTGKGLLHLNIKFADKQIAADGISIIAWLKGQFSGTSSVGGAVAVQLLSNVISRFLIP